ncbi:hypothetical protein AAFF_G00050060 [Aldrovandia affinis]|uniref:Uncharacterized protein n=1 Tax=Aldrovandia affinis TaxID=143900 RepID=A0AAD7S1F1_9TELE|nr:hypothetical protein AAFF_G00050060 [Aldrovandia affinis]
MPSEMGTATLIEQGEKGCQQVPGEEAGDSSKTERPTARQGEDQGLGNTLEAKSCLVDSRLLCTTTEASGEYADD